MFTINVNLIMMDKDLGKASLRVHAYRDNIEIADRNWDVSRQVYQRLVLNELIPWQKWASKYADIYLHTTFHNVKAWDIVTLICLH